MIKVGIVGCGAWATAFGLILAQNGVRVTMWCHRDSYASLINDAHENRLKLPGVILPSNLTATRRIEDLEAQDAIVIGLPSAHLNSLYQILPILSENTPILSLVKGMTSTGQLVSYAIQEMLPYPELLAVLSGPNLAMEIAQGLPAACVVAAEDEDIATFFQKMISSVQFRVYTSVDLAGVSWGGTLKNSFALAAGAVDGMGLGANAKAALLSRGLQEILKFSVAMGADEKTLLGLSGLGDLMATCHSEKSRNYQAGLALAQGKAIDAIISGSKGVIEGIETTKQVATIARQKGIHIPIIEHLNDVLAGRLTLRNAVSDLMKRDLKPE